MNITVKNITTIAIASILTGILLVFLLGPFLENFSQTKNEGYQPDGGVYQDSEAMEGLANKKRPVIHASNGTALAKEEIAATTFLEKAVTGDGADITNQVKIQGEQVSDTGSFYAEVPGIYVITYSVTDGDGLTAEKRISVLVNEKKKGGSE